MFLYNLTLQKGGGIQAAVYGNFSAPKAQEIVVSRNKVLELLRPDESGKMQTIVSVECFGIIRSLAAFRLTGANKAGGVVRGCAMPVRPSAHRPKTPHTPSGEGCHAIGYGVNRTAGCHRLNVFWCCKMTSWW
jgi:hypothetical protein